jgi:hypothetical protein
VRGEVPWCVACYARLLPEPQPPPHVETQPQREPTPEPTPEPASEPASEPTAEPASEPDAGPRCELDGDLQLGPDPNASLDRALDVPSGPDVEALAERLLAELAASAQRPAWSRRLPSTRAARAGLAAGLLAACCGLLLLAMWLAGLVL